MTQLLPYADTEFDKTTSLETILEAEEVAEICYCVEVEYK